MENNEEVRCIDCKNLGGIEKTPRVAGCYHVCNCGILNVLIPTKNISKHMLCNFFTSKEG